MPRRLIGHQAILLRNGLRTQPTRARLVRRGPDRKARLIALRVSKRSHLATKSLSTPKSGAGLLSPAFFRSIEPHVAAVLEVWQSSVVRKRLFKRWFVGLGMLAMLGALITMPMTSTYASQWLGEDQPQHQWTGCLVTSWSSPVPIARRKFARISAPAWSSASNHYRHRSPKRVCKATSCARAWRLTIADSGHVTYSTPTSTSQRLNLAHWA